MRLGIYIWLVLIFIISCCTSPGFLTALATILVIFALGILILWLLAKFTGKQAEQSQVDREKAIDEWEKLHGRKHPSRNNWKL